MKGGTIHEGGGERFFDRTGKLPQTEVKKGLSAAATIGQTIDDHFEKHPDEDISPSELIVRYNLKNQLIAVRPRFAERDRDRNPEGTLMRTDVLVPSLYGGLEARYRRIPKPLPVGIQQSLF